MTGFGKLGNDIQFYGSLKTSSVAERISPPKELCSMQLD
jgi:hypothetical protein